MLNFIKNRWPNFDKSIQYLMVAASIVLVSFLFPNSVKFKYEFQKGQEWRYEDLYAPFDFPINKTEKEIKDDQSQMLLEVSPYYRLNEQLQSAKLKDCGAAIEGWKAIALTNGDSSKIENEARNLHALAQKIIGGLLAKGVIEMAPQHTGADEKFVVNIVDGTETYKRTVSSFNSLSVAQKILADTLTGRKPVIPVIVQQAMMASLVANISFDEDQTKKVTENILSGFVSTKGLVKQGDLIVQRGNLITSDVYEKLVSFREKHASDIGSINSSMAIYIGYLLITILVFFALMMYINAYIKELLLDWKHLGFILMWILLFSYLTFIIGRSNVVNAYLIPFCIVPIVVSHFFNFRLAFFAHVIVVLLTGFLTTLGFPFIFMQIVVGVIAVLAVADARDWTKFFKSVLAIMLAYMLSFFAVSLVEEGSLLDIDWDIYNFLIINGLLTLLAFPLIPLVEKLFGFTTSISLVELSDMNRPLLRGLAIKAPGTLQHSLSVGNLCEAAAREIGANSLLLRVAALYHDIGKMEKHHYFIENQGSVNPHDSIDAITSAKIIIDHVEQGAKLAKKNKLPKVLIKFIKSHHGTTRAEYFYKNYLQNNPGVSVDEMDFTYPGPKPVLKEEGIMMMADSIEAAARALKNPSETDIDELVEKLVAYKVDNGQLDKCALTYGDVAKCKKVFKKTLKSIYHVRIDYPD